jgi:hypothetical protein
LSFFSHQQGTDLCSASPPEEASRSAVTKVANGQNGHRFPSFLPDGRRFAYVANGATERVADGIFSGSLDSNESTRVAAADSQAVYASSGDLLFVRDGTLLRQRFDLATRAVSGDPISHLRVARRTAVSDSAARRRQQRHSACADHRGHQLDERGRTLTVTSGYFRAAR